MASRMVPGTKPMRLVVDRNGRIRFSPKASAVNRCVGRRLRGQRFANRDAQIAAFRQATAACRGARSSNGN